MKKRNILSIVIILTLLMLPANVYAGKGGGESSYSSPSSSYSGGSSGSAYGGYTAGSGGDYYGSAGGTTVEIHSHGDGGGGSGDGGGGGGGPVCTNYTETIYAPDYKIAEVFPLVTKKDQRALVSVNIENIGTKEGNAKVSMKIGSQIITMTDVFLPANGNHALSFGYYTPTASGEPEISITVNPDHPEAVAPRTTTCNTCGGCDYTYVEGAEYDYANNTWTGKMKITKLPPTNNPDEPAPVPDNPGTFIGDLPPIVIDPEIGTGTGEPTNPSEPDGGTGLGDPYIGPDGLPQTLGNDHTETEWIDSTPTGSDKTYRAKLSMSVKVLDGKKTCTKLKSGYGFSVEVTCTVTTDYPNAEKIEAPKKVLLYVPDWGDYSKAIELKRIDTDGEYAKITKWELPKNSSSGLNAKKWYVPEWWPDNTDYNFLVLSKGTYTPGGELTAAVQTIKIDSNMYTDDYSVN